MGRSLSPLLRQELENLDKDADSRRSAMKALKSYAKHLDSKSIPHFLAEVSDNKGPGLPSGEFTISLYEVLARVHGRNIVPQISNIMSTIMCTLSSSGGSFPLHQACSKVVPAIARYGIDPSTPDEEKVSIISSLCKPLCSALMGNQDGAASGAALCLKTLVESNNWRFASNEMANEVCLKVAGALHDKATQSNAHMGLAMALVKHNGLIAEAYARSLVRSGLQILDSDSAESNSQKRFSAIQMINFLMKFVDPRSISSELSKVVDVMEQCQNDRMPFVRGAAFEASQTAKSIASQKGSRHEVGTSPMVGSNLHKRREKSPCRSLWSAKDSTMSSDISTSPVQFQSPESHVVDSSIMYDNTFTDSPTSIGQSSCNFDHNRRTNRRLWNNDGGVDVSLKDGFFLRVCSSSKYLEDDFGEVCNSELTETNFERTESFSGFVSSSPNGVVTRETTPSPQVSQRPISIDDIKIYATPRKLLRSLQSSYDVESAGHEEQLNGVLYNSSLSPDEERETTAASTEETRSQYWDCEAEEPKNENTGLIETQRGNENVEPFSDGDESASPTIEVRENIASKVSHDIEYEDKDVAVKRNRRKTRNHKAILSLLWSLIMFLLAIIVMSMRIDNYEPSFDLVPT